VHTSVLLRHIRRLGQPAVALTDRQLLQRFTLGRDEAAFAELVGRHGALVSGVCRRILRREQDAEDAFQAAFLVLAKKAATIRKEESVASWLYGVAWRCASRLRRDLARRRWHERNMASRVNHPFPEPEPEPQPQPEPESGWGWGWGSGSEFADLSWREVQEVLHEELARLPEKYRAPLVLCYLEGRTQCEAARQLGWGENVLRGRVDRGRERLRQRLTRRGITLSAALLAAAVLPNAPVSAGLVEATAKLIRNPASGIVAALANAVGNAGLIVRLRVVTLLLFTVCMGGVGLAITRPTDEPVSRATNTKSQEPKTKSQEQRTDSHGDPLPPGAVARLGSTRFRHSGLSDFVFLDGGKTILTCGSDRVLRFWDVVDGKPTRTVELKGSAGPGRSITLSPDGRTLAAHEGGNIVLWDTATGKEIKTLPGPKSQLGLLYFSPDGKTLAVGRGDLQVSMWEWQAEKEFSFRLPFTREMFQGLDSSFHGSFSPDGKWFVAGASLWEPLGIFEAATGREVHRLTCFPFHSRVSPDSKRLAVTGWKDDKGKEAVIRVFDLASGKETAQFPVDTTYHSFAFSPDGKKLACGFSDQSCVLDLTTGRVLYRLSGRPIGMEFSPDGKTLVASSGHRLRFWDARAGKEFHDDPAEFGYQPVLAVSPNGRFLAAGDWMEQEVRLWDAARGRLVHRLPSTISDKRYVLNVAFSADGRTVMAYEPMGFVQSWDVVGGKTIRTDRILDPNLPDDDHSRYHRFHVSLDGKRVATLERIWSPAEGTRIGLWDIRTGKLLHKRSFPVRILNAVWTGDGTIAVLPSADGLTVIDVVTGAIRSHVTDAVQDGRFRLSPDDRLLVAPLDKSKTGEIGVWEMATGKEVARIAAGRVDHLAPAADDRTLVTTDHQYLHVWDMADGKERVRRELPLKGIDSWGKTCVYALVLSPDGRRAFTAMSDGTCLVWDLTTAPPAVRRKPPTSEELIALWDDLADKDAAKAYQTLWRMADGPEDSVRFLSQKVKPTVVENPEKIQRLIGDLDSETFAVREKAHKELQRLGTAAWPALREAMEKEPSPEFRRRAEKLLDPSIEFSSSPDELRQGRALHVLEQIGSPESRSLLKKLAAGAPEARLTRDAKAVLQRLERR
jgi:RNA polymerase sigma factor (sigma-70 family)